MSAPKRYNSRGNWWYAGATCEHDGCNNPLDDPIHHEYVNRDNHRRVNVCKEHYRKLLAERHDKSNPRRPRHPDTNQLQVNWITARAVHYYGGNPKDRKNDPRWKECRERATKDAKAIDWVIQSSAITVSITEHSNVVPFPPVFENSREQVETVTKGRKRDQKVVTHVRKMYDFCSVEGCCYSDFDVAHIHALKHDADDLPSNCIALCPNHHRDLDRGRLQLADPSDRSATDPIMFSMGGWEGRIILNEGHEVHNKHISSCISEIDRFLSSREEQ